ncbi:hypothetical protein [Parachryseolinea silvisoli]|uniref:hypothetical protein n=1 Tax=Parachryseolinea silvisoli TaxID=2873601 RepID=UPI002265C025|nr:hypothetical protein [Parachryseolinea silvisoli]MCD9019571.1 hypothetical protein [Parachryseolinea silvisoli]
MRKNFHAFFSVLLFVCGGMTTSMAVDCQTVAGTVGAPANYNSASTWSCGHVPTSSDNVIINHPVTITGNQTYQWANQTITINSGGILKITGTLTVQGSNEIFNVNGGTLDVAGTITLDNQPKLNVTNNGVVKAGNIVMSNAARYVTTSGTLELAGSLTVPSGNTFTYPGTLSIPGDVTLAATGTTLTSSYVGGNISLTNSKLTLTTLPATTTSPGNLTLGSNSELVYSGGTLNYAAALTVNSGGKLTVNSGNVNLQDLTINAATVTVAGGNLSVTNAIILQNSNATLNFNSTGALSAKAISLISSGSNKNLNLTAGTMSVTNQVFIGAGASINTTAGTTSTAGSLSVADNSSAILNNNGSFTVNGNVANSGKINNNGTMHVTGNITTTSTGNSIFTNNGNLHVDGNVSMASAAKFQVNPGGTAYVDGNFTVNANQGLTVGTNVNPPAYADMKIGGNLISTGGGDALIDRNGRLAVFGSMTGEGGGDTRLTVNQGGQVYIDDDITFSGGGDKIINNNPNPPANYGLYVDGTITNTGGGVTTTPNTGDQAYMESSNKPFYDWVKALPNSPLPVILAYFRFGATTPEHVALQWATTLEQNFRHFEVERAGEALTFTAIAVVAGEGNEQKGAAYEFVDDAPRAGWNYYRLKQVDLDGTVVYSNVIRTYQTTGASSTVSLSPNPAQCQQVVTLSLQDRVTTPAMLTFIDGAGRVLLEIAVDESVTAIPLPANLITGIYAVRLASASGQALFRLVIQ